MRLSEKFAKRDRNIEFERFVLMLVADMGGERASLPPCLLRGFWQEVATHRDDNVQCLFTM